MENTCISKTNNTSTVTTAYGEYQVNPVIMISVDLFSLRITCFCVHKYRFWHSITNKKRNPKQQRIYTCIRSVEKTGSDGGTANGSGSVCSNTKSGYIKRCRSEMQPIRFHFQVFLCISKMRKCECYWLHNSMLIDPTLIWD